MQILGDSNAVLKDLTEIAEAEIMDRKRELYPLVTTDLEAADQAYVKIPIQTKVAFPTLFDGEGEDTSTEVAAVPEYNMATYMLRLGFGSDLMRESKAYSMASKTQEGTMSAKQFPSYYFTKNVLTLNSGNGASTTASGPVAWDGKQFYVASNATTGAHFWANSTNKIINSIASTGQTLTALWADLQTAVAQLGTFLDNQGRLLNPQVGFGEGELLIQCPVALRAAFQQLLHGGFIPISAPVTTSGTAAVTGSGPSTMASQFAGVADLFADGYLDPVSTTRWYLHYIGMPQRPFVWGQSYGLQGRALGIGTEYETRTNRVAIVLKHRFLLGTYRFDRSIRVG
jgi:hypothetical protein